MSSSISVSEITKPGKDWPVVMRKGHGEARVYRSESTRGYVTFFCCWYDEGKRRRVGLSSPELAMQMARQKAAELSDGSGSMVKIPLKHLLKLQAIMKQLNSRLPND